MWLDKCDYIFRLMAYRPWYRVYSCLQRRKVTPLPKIPNFLNNLYLLTNAVLCCTNHSNISYTNQQSFSVINTNRMSKHITNLATSLGEW